MTKTRLQTVRDNSSIVCINARNSHTMDRDPRVITNTMQCR